MSVDVTSLWSQSSPSSEFSTFSGSWSLVGGGGDVGELGGGGGGGGGDGGVGGGSGGWVDGGGGGWMGLARICLT